MSYKPSLDKIMSAGNFKSVMESMNMPWNYYPNHGEDNVKEQREKLRDYYGTAMTSGFPMAVINLAEVDSALELLQESMPGYFTLADGSKSERSFEIIAE